ncbi:MAG: hypothetical protein PHP35_00485 [Candidatus Colwellbacteria bacterium]|nr:hypothetical protein [Candidatus Colwellbacteria bacterium]
MGIAVEFCPDLALRNISEYKAGRRKESECLPESPEEGKEYSFLKKGQKNYWLFGEIPLRETKGGGVLSRPKASVVVMEATHFIDGEDIWTKGRYRIVKIIPKGDIYFEGYERAADTKDR